LPSCACAPVLQVLFKQVRHMPKEQQPKPVMVHTNFHPVSGWLGGAVGKRGLGALCCGAVHGAVTPQFNHT
jgi:hypothetical protein